MTVSVVGFLVVIFWVVYVVVGAGVLGVVVVVASVVSSGYNWITWIKINKI